MRRNEASKAAGDLPEGHRDSNHDVPIQGSTGAECGSG